MPAEARGGDRAARVVAVATARRAVRSAALWGLVFGGYVAYAALQFSATYPTAASRARVAAGLGGNPGLVALFGQGQRLGTVAGFTSWRVMGVLIAAIITNRWLADTSVLHHINPVPAANPDWKSATWLVGLAIATAAVGGIGFKLRDLASA